MMCSLKCFKCAIKFRDSIIIAILMFAINVSYACDEAFPNVSAFKAHAISGSGSWELEALGDLNADHVVDWTGILKGTDENIGYNQLFVLTSSECGFVVAASKRISLSGGGGWFEDLEIKRESVFVQTNSKSVSSATATTHQFKLYNGVWRLIGATVVNFNLNTGNQSEVDINLLTGDFIKTVKVENVEDSIEKGKREFPTHTIENFSFGSDISFGL